MVVTSGCVGLSVAYFFCQAEDGIRDLVRSRGLGDVYKRQIVDRVDHLRSERLSHEMFAGPLVVTPGRGVVGERLGPVSYTHLTLPTSDLV